MKKRNVPIDELVRFYENQKEGNDFSIFSNENFIQIITYYIDSENNEEALAVATTASKEYPYDTQILLQLSKILTFSKDYEQALEILEKAYLIAPSVPEINFMMGNIYDEIAESEMALEHLDIALKNCDGWKDEIFLSKARVYMHDDNYDEAILQIKKALKLNPENKDAITELVNCCIDPEEASDAILFYENLVDKTPYQHSLWNNLGTIYDSLIMHEKAIEIFELSASLDQNDPETFYLLGNANLNAENYSKAVEAFLNCLELGKKEYIVYSQLGLAYTFLDQYEEAKEYFQVSVKMEPEFAEGWYGLGIVNENTGNNKTAIEFFKKAISLNPSNDKFHYELAVSYSLLSDKEEAMKSFKQALELNPYLIEGWIDYSLLLLEWNKTSDAINSLIEGINSNPENADLHYVISGILFDKGLGSRGQFYLEKALKLNPDASDILFEIFPYLYSNDKIIELINNYQR